MLNKVELQGRLTADPVVRETNSGKRVVSFSIAVDNVAAGGEKTAYFFDCVAWEKKSEFVAKYFKKGSMILIAGRLTQDRYTNKDGKPVNSVKIVVEEIHFCTAKSEAEGPQGAAAVANNAPVAAGYNNAAVPQPKMPPRSSVYNDGFETLTDDDGDLPF